MDDRALYQTIGVLTPLDTPLRGNVAESFRRGVEVDGHLRVTPRLTVGGNAAWLHARIASFTDLSGDLPQTFRDVPPLLSPAWLSAQRAEWTVSRWLELGVEGRYQGQSFQRIASGYAVEGVPYFYVLPPRSVFVTARVGR